MRIALIGTRGIPARHGGFETCAEELSRGLVARGHDVTVYCRRGNWPGNPTTFEGVKLRYTRHLDRKALGTLTHTFTATLDALRRHFDVLLYFNVGNAAPALLAKLCTGAPIILNVDGMEWKRRKWGAIGRTYFQVAEWLSTHVADRIITDSTVIQRYYKDRWRVPSTFIPYGAHIEGARSPEVLAEYGLAPDGYFLTISRLEPENNADLTVQAFARVATDKKLVIVGDGSYKSEYAARLRRTADPRVIFPGAIHDPDRVRELYCGAYAYVHGNEVGGTNPALLRAMGHGCPVLALDVPYNAEVSHDAALLYRKDPVALAEKMREILGSPDLARQLGVRAQERIHAAYRWSDVVESYERVAQKALAGTYRGRPSSDSEMPEDVIAASRV
ncbi:MAG TPA: glycosyltransferase [Gemmatimonadales bacterium]|nr:glycosyltransferase [Gemmatimonadales bacterium]